jgi:predicted nucleic-acid-binding Zn-ribbon protein
MKKLTTEEVVERFVKANGNRYDYSKVHYTGSKSKVTVICHKHGDFDVILDKHMLGSNCPQCANEQYHKDFKKSTEEFISNSIEIHGNKYDYTKVNYYNNKTKVTIICPNHGEFNQRAGSHIEGYGCDMCKESFGERDIRKILENRNLKFKSQHRFIDCVKIKPLPFDFYLPEYNTCIEFNGKQHYEHNHFFVSNKGFKELKERDSIKAKYCEDNGLKLIIIRYDENISSKLDTLGL